MQAAPSTSIAQGFPLCVGHVFKGRGFPKRERWLGCHCTMLNKVARDNVRTKGFFNSGHQKKYSRASLLAPSSCAVAIQLRCNVLIGRDNGSRSRGDSKNPCRIGVVVACTNAGNAMHTPVQGSKSARVSVYRCCSARKAKTKSTKAAVTNKLVASMTIPQTNTV